MGPCRHTGLVIPQRPEGAVVTGLWHLLHQLLVCPLLARGPVSEQSLQYLAWAGRHQQDLPRRSGVRIG